MNYQPTIDTIEGILDDAAKSAAEVFLTDARKNLAGVDLSRHRIQFELEEVVVHAKRADDKPDTRYWYELSHTSSEPHRAMYWLGSAYGKLPPAVRRHLATKFLEIP